MLNDQSEIVIKRPPRARDTAPALRSLKRSGAPHGYNVKSATQLNIVLTTASPLWWVWRGFARLACARIG